MLQRALKEEGHAVDVAGDGPQGLWLATENQYAAIVLDVWRRYRGALGNMPVSWRTSRSLVRRTRRTSMSCVAGGTAAAEPGLDGPGRLGPVRLDDLLTVSCAISRPGQATLTFVGELDITTADQAHSYVTYASTCRVWI